MFKITCETCPALDPLKRVQARQRGGQRLPKTFLGFAARADQREKAKTWRRVKADRRENQDEYDRLSNYLVIGQ